MRFDFGASEFHALRDERFEYLLLFQLIGRVGRAPLDSNVPQFARRTLRADLRVVEHRDVERLGNHGEAKLFVAFRRPRLGSSAGNGAQERRNRQYP
jgi:hypothetical protein